MFALSAGVGIVGWPRQFIDSTIERYDKRGVYREIEKRRPNIYLGGSKQTEGDWLSFDDDLMPRTEDGSACVVCGEALTRVRVFGHTGAHYTNGPPAHPRCFALALRFCPRYSSAPYGARRQTVAYVWDGGPEWATSAPDHPWYRPYREGFIAVTSEGDVPHDGDYAGHNTDYGLRPRQVRAYNRAALVALAKSDPLGQGSDTPLDAVSVVG